MVAESHQELEEARKDSSLEPLEGARPYRHFDLGLVVSSVVLRHLVCAHLLRLPWDTKAVPHLYPATTSLLNFTPAFPPV